MRIIFYLMMLMIGKHYDFSLEKINISSKDYKLYPYFYLKNNEKIYISFWSNFNESKNQFFEINCNNNKIITYRSINQFYINDKTYNNSNSKQFYYLEFDKNNFILKINSDFYGKFNFKCDLQNLEFIYKSSLLSNNDTFIVNLQIFDSINNKTYPYLEFYNPIIYVDLRQENINSKFFKNRYNLFHGGFVGDKDNTEFNNFVSDYDKLNGVNWINYLNSHYIEWDKKIFYYLSLRYNRSFSIYLNFEMSYIFKDLNQIPNENGYFSLYQIYNNNTKLFQYNIIYESNTTDIQIQIKEIINNVSIFTNTVLLDDTGHVIKQKNKKEIGIKFIIINFNILELYSHYQDFKIGFKEDSYFKLNNNSIYEKNINNNYGFDIINSNFNLLKHYIGELLGNNFIKPILSVDIYLTLNEYGIFFGSVFDEIKSNKDFINYETFEIKGNEYLYINNELNFRRQFNLKNNFPLNKCITKNCKICNNSNICLFCYYNYYLDNDKNCILNTNANKIVNQYSELKDSQESIENVNFSANSFEKYFSINTYIPKINWKYNIISLSFKLKSFSNFNFMKISLNDPKEVYYNLNFEYNEITKPLTLFINEDKSYNNIFFEIKNSIDYNIDIKSFSKNIDCTNFPNEIVYKEINCFNYCPTNHYYKPINYYQGNCILNIEESKFNDINNNIVLNCNKYCKTCTMNSTTFKINCTECYKGFFLNNGNCYFLNEFDCSNNKNILFSWDYKFLGINLCSNFCELCNNKYGDICSLIDLNTNDLCNINNIKVIKINSSSINKFTTENCILYNKNGNCIKCNEYFYLTDMNSCEKCKNNCIKCNNQNDCINCNNGFFLNNNNCIICNFKYENCIECNDTQCWNQKIILNPIICNINNCSECTQNNVCSKCDFKFILKENKCILKEEYYINKLNYYNCNHCNHCLWNNQELCNTCKKCKEIVKFKIYQKRHEIKIYYDKNNLEINKNTFNIRISYAKNYDIYFLKKFILVRINDIEIINSELFISKYLVKNIKEGYFKQQIYKLSNFKKTVKKITNISKKTKFNKILYQNVDLDSFLENLNFLYYVFYVVYCFGLFIIFLPIILLFYEISLLFLLNINFNKSFINFLLIFKNDNILIIQNNTILDSVKFRINFEILKKQYKDNLIFGRMNFIDLDLLLIWTFLLIYKFLEYILERKKFEKKLQFIKKYYKYLKYGAITYFQANLIKYFYKIIFFLELFNLLDNFFIYLILGILVNFYIIIILLFFKNFFNLEQNKSNESDNIFNYFKIKGTKYFQLQIYVLEFITILILIVFRRLFLIQILFTIVLKFTKIVLLIKIYVKTKIKYIILMIVTNAIFFTVYLIFFVLKNDINNNTYLTIIIIILLTILINLGFILIYFFSKFGKFIKIKSKKFQFLNIKKKINVKINSFINKKKNNNNK